MLASEGGAQAGKAASTPVFDTSAFSAGNGVSVNDEQFFRLIDTLGYSRRGYRRVKKGVKKRIDRHMGELGCQTIDAYLEKVQGSAPLLHECRLRMTVPVSRFFRDASLWGDLKERVLPDLVDRFATPLAVWCAGCAGGEEVYTFRMLWEMFARRLGSSSHPYILATDIHPERFDRSENAVYPASSLREVPPELLDKCFERLRGGNRFRVREIFRSGIDWRLQDTAETAESPEFHLIFLRNSILTYDSDPRRQIAFEKVRDRLVPGGVLVIGTHETIPDPDRRFASRFPCCYQLR